MKIMPEDTLWGLMPPYPHYDRCRRPLRGFRDGFKPLFSRKPDLPRRAVPKP